jgi:hypothetical protein
VCRRVGAGRSARVEQPALAALALKNCEPPSRTRGGPLVAEEGPMAPSSSACSRTSGGGSGRGDCGTFAAVSPTFVCGCGF